MLSDITVTESVKDRQRLAPSARPGNQSRSKARNAEKQVVKIGQEVGEKQNFRRTDCIIIILNAREESEYIASLKQRSGTLFGF